MIKFRHAPCAFAALILLAGCGEKTPQLPTVGHELTAPRIAKCEPGQPGGRLTIAVAGAPSTFNPLLAGERASESVVRLLFSPLVAIDYASQEPQPALAESWSVAPDGKTWTFKLRPGLHWSDGHRLTAADVVFTWNEVMFSSQVNQDSHALFQINGRNPSVTKVDDLTVRIVTPEVFAPLVELFGNALILPEHAFGPSVRQRKFRFAYGIESPRERIVGSGPFRLKERRPDKSVLLERNPEYWTVDSQKHRLPYFDEVLITPSASSEVAAQFLNGKSDVYDHGKPEDYAQFKQAAGAGKFNLVEAGLATERDFIWFNLNTNHNFLGQPLVNPLKLSWFQNKKFRQAVSCAIDRERIVREIFGGHGRPILSFATIEDGKWNNPNVPQFAYDPSRAKSLLAEAGIQDRDGDGSLEDATGAKVAFNFNSNLGNPVRERCALFITEDLNKLGLKVDFQLLHFTNLVDRVSRTFDYDCILMGLGSGGSDPASQMFVLKSSGPLHQWFPYQTRPATEWEARIDALMDLQMSTLDFAVRKKSYDEIQMILAEEMPMIHTAAPIHFAAARSDLANLRPSVFTQYRLTWNIEELYLKTAGATNAP